MEMAVDRTRPHPSLVPTTSIAQRTNAAPTKSAPIIRPLAPKTKNAAWAVAVWAENAASPLAKAMSNVLREPFVISPPSAAKKPKRAKSPKTTAVRAWCVTPVEKFAPPSPQGPSATKTLTAISTKSSVTNAFALAKRAKPLASLVSKAASVAKKKTYVRPLKTASATALWPAKAARFAPLDTSVKKSIIPINQDKKSNFASPPLETAPARANAPAAPIAKAARSATPNPKPASLAAKTTPNAPKAKNAVVAVVPFHAQATASAKAKKPAQAVVVSSMASARPAKTAPIKTTATPKQACVRPDVCLQATAACLILKSPAVASFAKTRNVSKTAVVPTSSLIAGRSVSAPKTTTTPPRSSLAGNPKAPLVSVAKPMPTVAANKAMIASLSARAKPAKPTPIALECPTERPVATTNAARPNKSATPTQNVPQAKSAKTKNAVKTATTVASTSVKPVNAALQAAIPKETAKSALRA